MKTTDLISALDAWDAKGRWFFSREQLRLLFPDSSEPVFNKALHRQARAGVIRQVARGYYCNPRAKSAPKHPLRMLPLLIRPRAFSYVSLESVLSEAGWISQIPGTYTLISTGRSQTIDTCFGRIEYVHSRRSIEQLSEGLLYDQRSQIYTATPARALSDLKRVGRNLDLVSIPEDEDEAHT